MLDRNVFMKKFITDSGAEIADIFDTIDSISDILDANYEPPRPSTISCSIILFS